MARTRSRRDQIDIWPGFVDALSTLLMVIIFLLAVFMLGQFFMSQQLQGRDKAVDDLQGTVADLTRDLELEREMSRDLRRSVSRLSADLSSSKAEGEDLARRLDESQGERNSLSERLATVLSEQSLLQEDLRQRRDTEQERTARIAALEEELSGNRDQIQAERDKIEMQLAEMDRLREEIADLTAVHAELQRQIDASAGELAQRQAAESDLQTALADSEREKAEALAQVMELTRRINGLSVELASVGQTLDQKQQEIEQQSATISEMGERLNEALADKVQELSQFRSDFFGKLRGVLGSREDVRIVGDRFVFQSEVLFASGEAEIGPRGREQLAKLARTLKELAARIPPDIPWVLQVDGHTDKRPINTSRFPSNWELSTARAISVARFLISQGIPSDHVAARGLAEFQPLDDGETEDAYRRNRRIEIKLTSP
ncbi:MAG: peptidoglycan -binding protein [Geminicoccaceae bacterium]|nr:peptidoglycan -binding protein [Geminicoccaceae bacterium]